MPDDEIIEGQVRYRKKRDQKSKASKRSSHKHEYERCIVSGIIGWYWGEACKTCGRIRSGTSSSFSINCEGLRYPDKENKAGFCREDFYTPEELREKYPGVRIFAFKSMTPPYDFNYKEVKWDDTDEESSP